MELCKYNAYSGQVLVEVMALRAAWWFMARGMELGLPMGTWYCWLLWALSVTYILTDKSCYKIIFNLEPHSKNEQSLPCKIQEEKLPKAHISDTPFHPQSMDVVQGLYI